MIWTLSIGLFFFLSATTSFAEEPARPSLPTKSKKKEGSDKTKKGVSKHGKSLKITNNTVIKQLKIGAAKAKRGKSIQIRANTKTEHVSLDVQERSDDKTGQSVKIVGNTAKDSTKGEQVKKAQKRTQRNPRSARDGREKSKRKARQSRRTQKRVDKKVR